MGFRCDMKKPSLFLAVASGTFLAAPHAHADLPFLKEKPWTGYFVGVAEREARFGVTNKGAGFIEPLKKDGTPIAVTNPIKFSFDVLESTPDGKTIRKQIKDETLESDHQPVADPKEPVKFRGKVTGDAAFEVTVMRERNGISFSGKVTDKGALTNPLTFAITVDFDPYTRNPGVEKEDKKKFRDKVKRDEIRLQVGARERTKIDFLDIANPTNAAPEGFSAAEIRTAGYNGIGFEVSATDKSIIKFEDKGVQPLTNGFSFRWTVAEGADPATQKFTITTK